MLEDNELRTEAEEKEEVAGELSHNHTATIYGEDFTFQRLPSSQWIMLKRRCKNKLGGMDEMKLIGELLEHVVISPRISMDDREWAVINKVTGAAMDFMSGEESGF